MTGENHKAFYSIIDIAAQPLVTGRMQHVLNHDMAHRCDGKVVYYTAEDPDTAVSQKCTGILLREGPQVDGFIFLQIRQFCYGSTFNFSLLREFVEEGYEVHFTRESISIIGMDNLEQKKEILYIFFKIYGENRNERFLPSLMKEAVAFPSP